MQRYVLLLTPSLVFRPSSLIKPRPYPSAHPRSQLPRPSHVIMQRSHPHPGRHVVDRRRALAPPPSPFPRARIGFACLAVRLRWTRTSRALSVRRLGRGGAQVPGWTWELCRSGCFGRSRWVWQREWATTFQHLGEAGSVALMVGLWVIGVRVEKSWRGRATWRERSLSIMKMWGKAKE